MNQKDAELIRALGELLKKFKKIFHFSSFFHPGAIDEHRHLTDSDHFSDKNVDIEHSEMVNDATNENAIHSVLKKENFKNKEN
ncbi:MAG: hypothetical protein ABIT08_11190 [Bacteroidia bacterium]